jgi:cytoskeleton protein RodZ
MGEREHKDYRSLGEILREARVARGIDIADLSARTKISPRAIAALEADDLSQIAGPVYARSFTRNLAQALGLDAEFLLTKLALASPTAAARPAVAEAPKPATGPAVAPVKPATPKDPARDAIVWRIENVRVTKLEASRPRPGRRVWLVVAALALAAAVWMIARALDAPEESSRPQLGAPPTQLASPEASAPATRPSQSPASTEERVVEPASEATDAGSVAAKTIDAASMAAPDAYPEELAPGSPPTQAASPDEASSSAAGEAAERGLTSIERPGAVEVGEPRLTLVLRAERETEVWAAPDGGQRRHRILRPGEEWTLLANDHFSLEIDDPSAIAVMLDGVFRQPPEGLSGEWILYPDSGPR